MRRLLAIPIIMCLSGSMALAGTHTSPGYTLTNARIVVAGGSAYSLNYSLGNVSIGQAFGGRVVSANYSLDADPPYRRIPPSPPTLDPVTTPTNVTPYPLSGTKEPCTSIYVNGYETVPLDSETVWSCDVSLTEGENELLITARNSYCLESDIVSASITLDTIPPEIIIDEESPADGHMTYAGTITIYGVIRDVENVPFSQEEDLVLGLNTVTIEASDEAGNPSSVDIEIYRAREPVDLPRAP